MKKVCLSVVTVQVDGMYMEPTVSNVIFIVRQDVLLKEQTNVILATVTRVIIMTQSTSCVLHAILIVSNVQLLVNVILVIVKSDMGLVKQHQHVFSVLPIVSNVTSKVLACVTLASVLQVT